MLWVLSKSNFPLRHPPRASFSGVHMRRAAWGGGKYFFLSSSSVAAPAMGDTEPPSSIPSDSLGEREMQESTALMPSWMACLSPSPLAALFCFNYFSPPSFFTPHLSSGPKQFSRYGSSGNCENVDLYTVCRCFVKLGFLHYKILSFWEGGGKGTSFFFLKMWLWAPHVLKIIAQI